MVYFWIKIELIFYNLIIKYPFWFYKFEQVVTSLGYTLFTNLQFSDFIAHKTTQISRNGFSLFVKVSSLTYVKLCTSISAF